MQSGKFHRRDIPLSIATIPLTLWSVIKSWWIIKKISPDITISFGGYVSVPVIIASYLNRVPSITHEQTSTISLSTKINSLFVNKVALSFDKNSKTPKEIFTGNLIRQAIFNTSSQKFSHLKKPIIYITGGNQGSEFINKLITKTISHLKSFSIIHQTGKQASSINQTNYLAQEYIEIEDIGWVLNNSDIIVSRSGANICQEIDTLNKKAILIPLPFTQQDEQYKNANWLKSRHPHSIEILNQEKLRPNDLIQTIDRLQKIKTKKTKITKPTKNHPIMKLIHEIVK